MNTKKRNCKNNVYIVIEQSTKKRVGYVPLVSQRGYAVSSEDVKRICDSACSEYEQCKSLMKKRGLRNV